MYKSYFGYSTDSIERTRSAERVTFTKFDREQLERQMILQDLRHGNTQLNSIENYHPHQESCTVYKPLVSK